ncbi:hypothetical protein [Aeromicrobium endophyticum]|uniref:Uncharacterized protein n=1 Tax=Aeromicrobium endophyticum TaxID=2292704 RepID=A0A371P9N2_9ACTN|nr:hypothetical protein [Aeromicrobium endophyticum]REK72639.1 hypothetical protein DX116_03240 [Aeromicrobium endophyticum]
MKNLLRAAAIAVASTALVAGGTVTGAQAAPGDVANIGVQDAALNGYKGTTSKVIPVALSSNRTYVYATVNVNGVPVAGDVFVSSSGFIYQQAWGAGVVTLTGLKDRSGPTGQAVAGGSNAFTVRYGVNVSDGAQIKKRGKKLTFKVKVRYINAAGGLTGVRKAKLQAKKGSKWRTVKNVKLKKNGTRTVKLSDKKKRNYRIVVATTPTYAGTVFQTRNKI